MEITNPPANSNLTTEQQTQPDQAHEPNDQQPPLEGGDQDEEQKITNADLVSPHEDAKQNSVLASAVQNMSNQNIDTTLSPEDINKLESQIRIEQENTQNLWKEIHKLKTDKNDQILDYSKDYANQNQLDNLQQNNSQYVSEQDQRAAKKLAHRAQPGQLQPSEEGYEQLKSSSVLYNRSGAK